MPASEPPTGRALCASACVYVARPLLVCQCETNEWGLAQPSERNAMSATLGFNAAGILSESIVK